MLSVHLISGAASVPPLSLALFYKGKHLPNRAIRCAIYATSVYHVNCRLSTVSKICIQLVYKKFTIWRSFPLPAWLSVLSPAPRSCLAGTPPSPLRVLAPQVQPVPLPAQARGCKGRSPPRHWLSLPRGRGPSQTPPSLATDSSISPGFPLSLAAGTALRKGLLSVLRRTTGSLARGVRIAEAVSAVNGLMQGCRGRSPRRNKLLISPFPGGEGGWGDGGKKVN